ncbi:hypothetical protein C5D04_10205 [Rathayibacter sp. AY1D2]|uniref:hypothetical protein n=1 Tax=unclassified Rathayibacter TaxID=2609250 RepID=UPI000CE7DA06|nr:MULTISPECIES: hypothetical protein [unclassified Rathayibacter]PPG79300.1 hypothetical protein C5C52_12750 [Rathayibacter sp. AY1E5]PPH18432.1 hypothetical protein C5C99_13560 [Rathayibacter sp. AY1C4]PPH43713.1 hypothetical protein C5D09_14450 [Rathayibacter sp. AY1C9]PPH65140.1 hypothetical protein C5D25_04800 [Rathayibacter sp. AY1D7]PPH96844.1 hypothetical protein C5C56_13945 [Rathayibacter sp. AY1D1]
MTRLRSYSRAVGTLLISAGVVGAAAFLLHWGQCFGGLTDGCYAATQSDFPWVAMSVLWVITFPLAIVGAFLFSPKQPITLIGVVLLMLINPLTDHGLFFVPWDVADTLPFTGLTIAFAAIAAGALQIVSSQRVEQPLLRGSSPEQHQGHPSYGEGTPA